MNPVWNSLKDYELTYEEYPNLYRLGGVYLAGLAWLMGAFYCSRGDPLENTEHEFVDGKCTHCGIRKKEKA